MGGPQPGARRAHLRVGVGAHPEDHLPAQGLDLGVPVRVADRARVVADPFEVGHLLAFLDLRGTGHEGGSPSVYGRRRDSSSSSAYWSTPGRVGGSSGPFLPSNVSTRSVMASAY